MFRYPNFRNGNNPGGQVTTFGSVCAPTNLCPGANRIDLTVRLHSSPVTSQRPGPSGSSCTRLGDHDKPSSKVALIRSPRSTGSVSLHLGFPMPWSLGRGTTQEFRHSVSNRLSPVMSTYHGGAPFIEGEYPEPPAVMKQGMEARRRAACGGPTLKSSSCA